MMAMGQRLDTRGFFFHPQLSVATFFALVLQVFRNRLHCHGHSVPEPATSILSTLALCYIRATSTMVLTTSGSPSFVGQPVTFAATIKSTYGSLPDGDLVTFYDAQTILGSVLLVSGTATYTTSSFTAKGHVIKAVFPGDSSFIPSGRTLTQVVQKYATATKLTTSPNPSTFGQTVSLTARA